MLWPVALMAEIFGWGALMGKKPGLIAGLFIFKEIIGIKEKRPAESASLFLCAKEEIRTPKPFRALPPQSSASTNFATFASGRMGCKNNGFFKISKFIYSYFVETGHYFRSTILKVVPLLISDDLT